jgi:Protein of unknown function (DUF2924)
MAAKSRKTTKKPAKAAKVTPAPAVTLVPGTVLRKLDRAGKVRCECTVEAGGYKYDGKLYGSLSGAAAAAAKKLALTGKSFNGYVFWGLKQPGGRDALHRVKHLWQRYAGAATALLKTENPEKAPALECLRQHAAQLKALVWP